MTVTESVPKLKELNDRLAKLLADPQPGIPSWVIFVGKTIESMADIVGYEPKVNEVNP